MINITRFLPVAIAVTAIVALLFLFGSIRDAKASAPPGLRTTVATTSPAAVTTSASVIFATSTCDSRIISTTASPIMLTFSENQNVVPSAIFGHLQAASTTVAYDSALYGCGAVQAYSFVNGTVTLTEAR